MDLGLAGKRALVTGASSGIGVETAKLFAAEGAAVVVCGRDRERTEATVREIERAGGSAVMALGELTSDEGTDAIAAAANSELGGIDILVNNAGIQHVSPIEDFAPEKWDAVIAINLTSSFHTIRAVLPAMKQRKWGRIINVCSAHSLRASAHKAAYVAAKHGLAGLTKVVALECATSGVTANAISPGFVWTPLVEDQLPDIAKAEGVSIEEAKAIVLKRQPSGEFATVDQIGALATFLASDPAAAITGSNYSIDGGWTVQ